MAVKLTKIYRFFSAHRVYNPAWDDEKNAAIFGKCSNPNGHGHMYTLEVTVEGAIDPDTGFCIELTALNAAVCKQVLDILDHKHLNEEVSYFIDNRASAENILSFCWQQLQPHVPSLKKLVLNETENNKVTLEK